MLSQRLTSLGQLLLEIIYHEDAQNAKCKVWEVKNYAIHICIYTNKSKNSPDLCEKTAIRKFDKNFVESLRKQRHHMLSYKNAGV